MVEQTVFDTFIKKICSEPPNENYDTNKTVIKPID